MTGQLITHLWQSTLFAIAAGLLTLAFRGNRAKVRFGLWLCASLKFFVPFALLMSIGSHIRWTPAVHDMASQYATPALAFAMDYVAEPFTMALAPAPAPAKFDWPLAALLSVWASGFLTISVIRLRLWFRVGAALRASKAVNISSPVGIRSAPGLLEPGVVGLLKPVLLLPEGITERLMPTELEALLAHELCHVRRRDNLFAAIHMLVEAVFWFHPLVWWIGARMLEERERACDEDVLNLGSQPRVYADAILSVCKLYAESPLVCVSGVSGSNIRRRIEAIMRNRRAQTLNRGKKVLLAVAGSLALAGPVIVGVLVGFGQLPEIHAQSPAVPLAVTSIPATTVVAQAPPVVPVQEPSPTITRFQDRRLTVMLFDVTAMTADQQARAKLSAALYIENQMKPGDLISVMSAASGIVQVLQDFTGDSAVLKSAIQNLKAGPDSTPAPEATFAAIESAASMLRAFPQKKALMYYSSRIAQPAADNQAALRHAIAAAAEANMAILPVDTGSAPAAPGSGRGMATPAQPAGISAEEYARRVAYAQSTFGAKGAMTNSYIRYGAPDQIEDRGTSAVWRYKYLEDYQSGAAFEFPKGPSLGVHILYPQPAATFEGSAGDVAQVAPLTGGLRGGGDASGIKAFPNQHPSIQVYMVAPGTAPAPDRRYVPVSIPIDAVSGVVDIVSQVRTRPDDQQPGQIMANLADNVQAPSGTYQAAFTLRPGAYVCKVLVREASTGRMFGDVINFDVK